LRSRLLKAAQEEHEAKLSVERRSQIGGGGRGEKIRTYNFKENRLTDHRIGFTIYSLSDVLAGDLDAVIDALANDERARQLAGQDA
jgi:peptide chain release factor 1